jgi:NhaP-type Na+/H+ or K+/H+ antiporter
VVALATVIAHYMPARTSARDRVNAYAVWAVVVFVLNVLAFLIMGLQARVILQALAGTALWHALAFAGAVLGVVILVRFAWVMSYGIVMRHFKRHLSRAMPGVGIPKARQGILVSWCGMRGLVTLATAFALPPNFPRRDLLVLAAFTVVLGTLIIQGLTIRPLIALLKIAPDDSLQRDVASARAAMLDAALSAIANVPGEAAAAVRGEYHAARAASADRALPGPPHDAIRLMGLAAQRRELVEWRRLGRIDDDAYHLLEEYLDRADLGAQGTEM